MSSSLKIEIHTIRFGNPDWLHFCSRSLDSWCDRHGFPLKIWNETNIDPSYPADKFCEVDMLREFLASDNEWLGYIDADVWIEYDAGVPPLGPGLNICPDRVCKWVTNWPSWCRDQFSATHDVDAVLAGKTYYNAGIWFIDREAAATLLSVISEPYIEHCQEQDHWNWWLALAADNGMKITPLSREWNRFPTEDLPGHFHHLAGTRKLEKSARRMKLGLMPQAPEPFATPQFGDHERAIVIPWKRDKARWEELRYAIRSIQENFEDKDCPIYIIGDFMPHWYEFRKDSRVKFISACLYSEALIQGMVLAEKILWTNDDICFLKPVGWDHFDTAIHTREITLKEAVPMTGDSNEWVRGLGRAVISLAKTLPGQTILNFSTHTPYLFERDKGLETLRLYGAYHKVPVETLYHNHWQTPVRPMGTEKTMDLGTPESVFLSYNDGTLTPEVTAFLEKTFPTRHIWELKV